MLMSSIYADMVQLFRSRHSTATTKTKVKEKAKEKAGAKEYLNDAKRWREMCTADLDLPVGYCDSSRDAQLEQVRETRAIPLLLPAVVSVDDELGPRIAIPDQILPHAPGFRELLDDLHMALGKPRNARLVATYMCILYNVAERAKMVSAEATKEQKRVVTQILAWYRLAVSSYHTDGAKRASEKGSFIRRTESKVIEHENSLALTIKSMRWHLVVRAIDWYWYYIYEQPWPFYRTYCRSRTPKHPKFDFDGVAQELQDKGVVILPSFVDSKKLKRLQSEFDSWCAKKTPDVKKVTKIDGGLQESCLSKSIDLSRLAVNPFLVGLASHYLGKPARLAYARGYRQEPIPHERYRAFQWHHDLKRKMIKIMILLTDVPARGQRMDYAVGTHRTWHQFSTQLDTTFDEKDIDRATVLPCSGPAGTVIIFDPNGLHTGTRNNTVRRDQYTFNYTGGHGMFPVNLHPQVTTQQKEA